MPQSNTWWTTPLDQLDVTPEELRQAFAERDEYDKHVTFIEEIPLAQINGRFPVNTGLARHPSGNGWLVGDDGRVPGNNTSDGGVIWYSDDFQTVLANWKISPSSAHSVQGVAAVSGTNEFWCLARHIPIQQSGSIMKVNATTGAVLSTFSCVPTANGLAVIPEQNAYVILLDDGKVQKFSMSDGNNLTGYTDLNAQTTNDMLYYAGNGRMLSTWGMNGNDGSISKINVGSGFQLVDSEAITGATAIEGVCVHDGLLYVNNDGHYHGGGVNAVRVYSLETLLK